MTDAPSEAVFYLDTSALVKRYVVERGSSWLAQLCSPESDKTIHHKLRGYDAVQLAAALELNSILLAAELAPATFVAADDELLSAAQKEGLLIANPNDH